MIKICKAQRASQKILSTTNQVYIFVNIFTLLFIS